MADIAFVTLIDFSERSRRLERRLSAMHDQALQPAVLRSPRHAQQGCTYRVYVLGFHPVLGHPGGAIYGERVGDLSFYVGDNVSGDLGVSKLELRYVLRTDARQIGAKVLLCHALY